MQEFTWRDARRATRRRPRSFLAATAIVGTLLMIRLWLSASALPTRRAALVSIALVFAALLLVAALAIKLCDVGGHRDDRVSRAHRRIERQLRGALGELPVTVVASGPPSSRSPVVIEVRGSVDTDVLRETVLGIVQREVAGLARDVRVVDRLEVASRARPSAA
jgi:hypothetical protein